MQETKLAHLTSILTSMESRAQSSFSSSASSLASLHSSIASLEQSLREEISRRGDMERRIQDGVQAQVRLVTDRLADAVESEMTRLYRKMDSEVGARLDSFARELAGALSTRLPKIEEAVYAVQNDVRRLESRIGSADVKLRAAEEKLLVLAEELRGVAEDTREDATRKQSAVGKELDLVRNGIEGLKLELKKSKEESEAGRKELRVLLEAEVDAREEGDKDLVEVVTQYAGVLKRLQA